MWLVARNFPPPGGEPFSCGPDEWRVRWKEKWHHPGVSWETSLSAIQAICLCTVLIHNNSYLMTLSTWSRSRPRPVSRCQNARKNCLITGRNLEQSRVGCHVTTPVGFVLSWFLSTSFLTVCLFPWRKLTVLTRVEFLVCVHALCQHYWSWLCFNYLISSSSSIKECK